MNNDLIRRHDVCDRCSDYSICQKTDINCPANESPAAAAVPVSELLELRDLFYESDGITMNNLAMLNQLIAKYNDNASSEFVCITRCENCEYWHCGDENMVNHCKIHGTQTDRDDFCSYGMTR